MLITCMENLPPEKEIDTTYIGQWEVVQLDDYLTQKAGTRQRNIVTRSKVDRSSKTVHLYAYLPLREKEDHIVADGTVGLKGKITERHLVREKIVRTTTLWIHPLTSDQIKNNKKGNTIFGTCEFDDVVYNPNGKYTYPVKYILSNKILRGLHIEIPIADFNNYIRMRN